MWRRDVVMAHEQSKGFRIQLGAPLGVNLQRFEFRTEQEHSFAPSIIERLLPRAVADQMQAAFLAVPGCKGEHAQKTSHGWLDSTFLKSGKHYFGIGMAAKDPPPALQLRLEIEKIVDFSVENQDIAAMGGSHWLMALSAQILDREPAMRQADAGRRVGPDPLVIRTTMAQCSGHFQGELLQFRLRGPSRWIYKSSNAAHEDRGSALRAARQG